ncbi:MAG: ATPase [Ruminococcus sp.]|nr:ATPase [Ruminococcus sp.]
MSVENIKAFSIIGHKNALDEVVLTLGKSKVFQPDEVNNFYSDTGDFTRVTAAGPFNEALSRYTNAMRALGIDAHYVRVGKKFNPDFDRINEYSIQLQKKADKLTKAKAEAKQAYNECKRAIEETSHFVGLDQNIEELLQMEYVKAVFGRMPKDNVAKLEVKDYDYIEFVPCSEEGQYVWGVYFVPLTQYDKAERIFSRLYFEKSSFASMDVAPAKRFEQLTDDKMALKNALEKINGEIETFVKEKSKKILMYYTKASEYNLFLSIRTHAMERGDSFCLVGWIPQKQSKALREKLTSIESVEVAVSNAKDEPQLSPPVKLKNFFLARPFQFYTEMYGVPKYKEIDPTAFIAFTYVILFGIMFGDVGHGLCVMIAGLVMWFAMHMPIGKILVPCGFSGAVFGALYGSVFGYENAMDWLYVGVLGMHEKPIEVMSPNFTNTILYSAVGIGMLLLCFAMILNIYTSLRQGNIGKMIFDTSGICGLIFYGMICAGIAGMMMFNTNLFSIPYIIVIAIMFILIFLREPLGKLVDGRSDWKPESWGGFIMENVFESIEVILSYVTNTMSFLRVAAFVLVHAGMMQVVFTLADTIGGAGYIPVVIIGNALVCVLEALLVCIQVLRLEFYEMFSRFYSGEGKPYEPVRLSLAKN